MAANNPKKRESLSQSQSQSKNGPMHIPVMDYDEYQQQQQKAKNAHSSKDDMFLTFAGGYSPHSKQLNSLSLSLFYIPLSTLRVSKRKGASISQPTKQSPSSPRRAVHVHFSHWIWRQIQ